MIGARLVARTDDRDGGSAGPAVATAVASGVEVRSNSPTGQGAAACHVPCAGAVVRCDGARERWRRVVARSPARTGQATERIRP